MRTGMRAVFCALSCLLLMSPAVLAKAAVEPNPQQISEYEASTEATRVKLLINLAKSGQHDLAESASQTLSADGRIWPQPATFH